MTASEAEHTASAISVVSSDSDGDVVSIRAGEVEILRHRLADAGTAPYECPTPYLHPVRTLSGGVVTGHRPHDHRWHKGLTMAVPRLGGTNFWGGPSYVPGRGYVDLGDVGRIVTRDFVAEPDGTVRAELAWIDPAGAPVAAEQRTVAVRDVDAAAGSWTLEFRSEIRLLTAGPLEFASPTVLGRDLAGYCGLFWRGPRSFTGGRVLSADGREGAARLMGERARWLAFTGEFDDRDGFATLAFAADDGSPAEWFVRSTDYPGVNPSLAFRRPLRLEPGAPLRVGYCVLVADGAWPAERVEAAMARYGRPRPPSAAASPAR